MSCLSKSPPGRGGGDLFESSRGKTPVCPNSPTIGKPKTNCLSHLSPPMSKFFVRCNSATVLKEGGLAPPERGIAASHDVCVGPASNTICFTFSSCDVRNISAVPMSTFFINCRELLTSSGKGAGFGSKNSMSISFRTWPTASVELVIWQVNPFLCSPAQVYRLGVNDASSRSLLYDFGLVIAGILSPRKRVDYFPIYKLFYERVIFVVPRVTRGRHCQCRWCFRWPCYWVVPSPIHRIGCGFTPFRLAQYR